MLRIAFRYWILGLMAMFPMQQIYAQHNVRVVLLNSEDSTVIPFAVVKIKGEKGFVTVTDERGNFSLSFAEYPGAIEFEIGAIGIKAEIQYTPRKSGTRDSLFVQLKAVAMEDFVFKEKTALQVVQQAIASIPDNYEMKKHVTYSFYREYKKINETFTNLLEARMALLFLPEVNNSIPKGEEAAAILSLRRSDEYERLKQLYGGAWKNLFAENPIYHLQNSFLRPSYLVSYAYAFIPDSSEDYVIRYDSKFSTERHGCSNPHFDEGYEHGILIIDRNSYVIKRIERLSRRHANYHYPRNDNFILPKREYVGEFLNGRLILEYRSKSNKWYLDKALYAYTNDFLNVKFANTKFRITECYEWFADSVSRYVAANVLDKFYYNLELNDIPYVYEQTNWQQQYLYPYFFFTKEEIEPSIQRHSSLNDQFVVNQKTAK